MWGHNVNDLQKLQTLERKYECYFMWGWQLKKVRQKKKKKKTEKKKGN